MSEDTPEISETEQDIREEQWRFRRRLVLYILAFCALAIGYIIGWPSSTETIKTAGNGLVLLFGTTVTSYVAGAVIDDRTNMLSSEIDKMKESRWERRKAVIVGTMIYCAVAVTYMIYKDLDQAIHATMTNALIFLAGSTALTFIFGAAADDWNYAKNKGRFSNSGR